MFVAFVMICLFVYSCINKETEYFKDKDDFFESTLNKFRKTSINTTGNIELLILNYIFDISELKSLVRLPVFDKRFFIES